MAGPLRGGGVKDRAIKEKRIFGWTFFFQRSNVPTANKLEGGGGKALLARPFFCGFPKGNELSQNFGYILLFTWYWLWFICECIVRYYSLFF